jgi:hypothetical protein
MRSANVSDALTLDLLRELGDLASHPDVVAARQALAGASAAVEEQASNVQTARTRSATTTSGLEQRQARREAEIALERHDIAMARRAEATKALQTTQVRVHETAAPLVRVSFRNALDELEPQLRTTLAFVEAVGDALDLDARWAAPSGGSVPSRRALPPGYGEAVGRLRQALTHWLETVIPGAR